MTSIKPISDLRNYNEVLKDVDTNGLVYLTRNGNGAYGILTINEIDEYMRLKALHGLLSDLDRAKQRAEREGWISEEEMDQVMGL
ncbi:Antitoxin Phd_YefM, type II toxin-antitoxin system [Butyrivibrio sp. INlla18]|uniref:prevent-host-death protein n=1 Tax=Butyrivibrio sp. INlla18 TaxID=1520806 RepID=UPI00088E8F1B|nr:prevent-host-death protein [Butyrivibrio sp. INlla18]SDA79238.1 Antitoxin Phd_YefM, type II toxin-antitoxin system [Butyrivibrio sp. INlla18]